MKRATIHFKSGKPAFCCYCKRDLLPKFPERERSMTFDHHVPQAAGGVSRVPCCLKCNRLKADIKPDDWHWFIGCHPRYWRTFDTPAQVKAVIREFRVAQAWARTEAVRAYGDYLAAKR